MDKKTVEVYTTSEARAILGTLIDRVSHQDESVSIALHKFPAALLVPVTYVAPVLLKDLRRETVTNARLILTDLVDWVSACNVMVVIQKNTADIREAVLISTHRYREMENANMTKFGLPPYNPPRPAFVAKP